MSVELRFVTIRTKAGWLWRARSPPWAPPVEKGQYGLDPVEL